MVGTYVYSLFCGCNLRYSLVCGWNLRVLSSLWLEPSCTLWSAVGIYPCTLKVVAGTYVYCLFCGWNNVYSLFCGWNLYIPAISVMEEDIAGF